MRASFLWHGARTVAAARAALAQGADVALHLPAGYHHTLCARFGGASSSAVESLDIAAGGELLREFERVRGLEAIAGLEPAARRVRLVSPSPTVYLFRADSIP